MKPIYLLSPTPREDTISLPMIEFALTADSIDFSSCDTLMFSSKQAVRSADQIGFAWRKYPAIAIGSATRKMIEILGVTVIHQPKEFYADELAEDIARLFAKRKILYLRPKNISFDSKGYLATRGIELQEQIIYETTCKRYSPNDKPVYGSIIIFTSPSSIYCFLKNFSWHESYIAIVIGRATKQHLPKNAKYFVSDMPLIDSCIQKAREISTKSLDTN